MSQPPASPAASQEYADLDPWNGMFYAMAERLTPLMAGEGRGKTYGRYAAGEAIAGYHPGTRADYATIGRILSLSLSTVTAAALAVGPDLETAEQIRFLGKVQGLSQAADRAERLMMARRQRAEDDNIRGDTLVPRPAGRPPRYAPLPADDPASGAFRAQAAEAKIEAPTTAEAASPQGPSPQTTSPKPQPDAAETLGNPTSPVESKAVEPTAAAPQAQPGRRHTPSVPPTTPAVDTRPIPAFRPDGEAIAMSFRETLLSGSAIPPVGEHGSGAPI